MTGPDPYYFDYSASEPPYEEALDAFVEYSENYPANPSSMHASGKEAGKKLLELKMQFCDLLGLSDGHLLLCSSATEANNTVIEGHRRYFPEGRIWMAEDVHDSLWYASQKHSEHTDLLPIDLIENPYRSRNWTAALKPGTSLICLNHVCNETGRIQHLAPIARFCEIRGIRLLVDGSQAVGHIPVNLETDTVRLLSFFSTQIRRAQGSWGDPASRQAIRTSALRWESGMGT